MDLLITFAALLALGVIGLALLKVAKNVAYLFFILVIGALMWIYVVPLFIGEQESVADTAKSLGDSYSSMAMKDMDKNTRDDGNKIANAVTEDVQAQMEAADRKEGIESWKVGESAEAEVEVPPASFYDRFVRALSDFFRTLFE